MAAPLALAAEACARGAAWSTAPRAAGPPRLPAAYFSHALTLLQQGDSRAGAAGPPALSQLADALDSCVDLLLRPLARQPDALGARLASAAPLPLPRLPHPALAAAAGLAGAAPAGVPPLPSAARPPDMRSPLRGDDAAKRAAGLAPAGSHTAAAPVTVGTDRYGQPLSLATLDDRTAAWLDAVPPALGVAAHVCRLAAAAAAAATAQPALQPAAPALPPPGRSAPLPPVQPQPQQPQSLAALLVRSVAAGGSWSVGAQLLVAVAAFRGYCAWATPASAAAADDLACALGSLYPPLPLPPQGLQQPVAAPPCDAGSGGDDAATAVGAALERACAAHAPELARWCAEHTADGAWKEPTGAPHVRFVVSCVAAHTPARALAAAPPATLRHLLSAVFRLCDDWQATSAWLGAAALCTILARADSGDGGTDGGAAAAAVRAALLQPPHGGDGGLLAQCVTRSSDCKHPTVAAVAHAARLAWLRVHAGRAPAAHRSVGARAVAGARDDHAAYVALVRAASRARADDEHASSSFFDGPYDAALAGALHALALASSPELQFAHLAFGLAPLLHALFTAGGDDGLEGGGGGGLRPQVAAAVGALVPCVVDSGDARVVCAALHCLRLCALGSGGSMAVPDALAQAALERAAHPSAAAVADAAPPAAGERAEPKDGAAAPLPPQLHARADLADACLACAAQAHAHAGAGLCVLPPEPAAGGREGSRSTGARVAAGGQQLHAEAPASAAVLVRAYAAALAAAVCREAPAYTHATLRRLDAETCALLTHAASQEAGGLAVS